MKNVALKIDGLTFRPIASDIVDEGLEWLRELYGEKTDWHGESIKFAWKFTEWPFSRVQNKIILVTIILIFTITQKKLVYRKRVKTRSHQVTYKCINNKSENGMKL